MLKVARLIAYTGTSVSSAKNVPNLLANFERVQREITKTNLEKEVRHTMRILAEQMRPWRIIPEVNGWEATFETVRFRYNFLVLDGPSKMGKTLFYRSRSLGSPRSLLEIDCAGDDTPDLTSYEYGLHTMVLCDEGSAEMVLCYKKPFQASASYTRLASSRPN